jgi:hypothetical protein
MKDQKNEKTFKTALEKRCGDLGKSGPGARAKADALINFYKFKN